MKARYADGLLQVSNLTSTRSAISSLLQKYRKVGERSSLDGDAAAASVSKPASPDNVIHIVHSVPDGTPIFTPKSALAHEFPELIPLPHERVISKKHPGAFKDTNLHDSLQTMSEKIVGTNEQKQQGQHDGQEVSTSKDKKPKLVLAGYMAHVCVSTTARQAAELGYEVIVAGDAVGDRDIPGAKGEEVTKMVLLELADAFAEVVESRDIVA